MSTFCAVRSYNKSIYNVLDVDIVTDGNPVPGAVADLHSGDLKHAAVPRLALVGGEVEAQPVPGGGQHLGEAGLGCPEVILLTQVTRVAVNIEETKPADTEL